VHPTGHREHLPVAYQFIVNVV